MPLSYNICKGNWALQLFVTNFGRLNGYQVQKVFFNYADKQLVTRNKKIIKQFITGLFEKESKALERLDYIFCSDNYLLEINKKFLNHDFYTDIISFDLSNTRNETTGEIYISVDRVKENAAQLAIPYKQEMLRVLFHGALHLCGYKDKKTKEIELMRIKEEEYLQLFAALGQ